MVKEGWGNREESQNSAQCQDACRIRWGKNPKDCEPDRHSLSFCRKYQHLATKLSRWKFKDRARYFITRGFLYHQESLDLTPDQASTVCPAAAVAKKLSSSIAVRSRGEVCPMPYALCPMPYALCTSEHVTEKDYIYLLCLLLP
ncbi:hypothetical protein [Microcoleus sp.]|uniref:hypothetical protein n=1 Tax=Microcoleus sp. TaxID=44472 RepID=UPI00403EF13F